MEALRVIQEFWHYLVAGIGFVAAVAASGHAVLNKRDSRAAVMWVGVIWLSPLVGPLLYLVFGINRIERKAISLWRGHEHSDGSHSGDDVAPHDLTSQLGDAGSQFQHLVTLVNGVSRRSLVSGNSVRVLDGGDAAYPEMLTAINTACDSVNLLTYIFDFDSVGTEFIEALAGAAERGVDVRVLVDDAGGRYSRKSVSSVLRLRGVRCERFLRTLDPWKMMGLNLRNHRKLLITDARVGFTGGMNIREGCRLERSPANPTQDLHFRVEGPVVAHLQEAFVDDWLFVTGEAMASAKWFPDLESQGKVVARGISDGPDGPLRAIRWTMVGALNLAQRNVMIVTPYFLPDEVLVMAMNQAARRGVNVDIVLPEKGNLSVVQWAMQAGYWKVLRHGVRIWLSPEPFDHTKLLVVDGVWSLIGSSNWDPRSLRLNFEFNLECYDRDLAQQLGKLVEDKIAKARHLTLSEIDSRPFPARLRDGVARLATPFL